MTHKLSGFALFLGITLLSISGVLLLTIFADGLYWVITGGWTLLEIRILVFEAVLTGIVFFVTLFYLIFNEV